MKLNITTPCQKEMERAGRWGDGYDVLQPFFLFRIERLLNGIYNNRRVPGYELQPGYHRSILYALKARMKAEPFSHRMFVEEIVLHRYTYGAPYDSDYNRLTEALSSYITQKRREKPGDWKTHQLNKAFAEFAETELHFASYVYIRTSRVHKRGEIERELRSLFEYYIEPPEDEPISLAKKQTIWTLRLFKRAALYGSEELLLEATGNALRAIMAFCHRDYRGATDYIKQLTPFTFAIYALTDRSYIPFAREAVRFETEMQDTMLRSDSGRGYYCG